MNNVISFQKYQVNKILENNLKNKPLTKKVEIASDISVFSSPEEDSAFYDLVKEWPCFKGIDHNISLLELFDLYYDDGLNPAQDYVLEFMFHLHDPNSSFDVSNALYAWNEMIAIFLY